MDLNHARLPIPPLRRQILGGDLGIARQDNSEINIFTGVLPVVKPAERADDTADAQIAVFLGNSWILACQEAFQVA